MSSPSEIAAAHDAALAYAERRRCFFAWLDAEEGTAASSAAWVADNAAIHEHGRLDALVPARDEEG
jgi:hypothetical protein